MCFDTEIDNSVSMVLIDNAVQIRAQVIFSRQADE